MFEQLLLLDQQIFSFLHEWVVAAPAVWKWLAILGVYTVPILLLWLWFTKRREIALYAALVGLVAWQGINALIAVLVQRDRPVPLFDLQFPDKEFLFDRPGPSFPSDHAAFLMSVTIVFWLAGEKKLATLLFVITVLTTLARVVTAQHWPGDILVGFFVGFGTVWLFKPLKPWLDQQLITPLIAFAKKLGF